MSDDLRHFSERGPIAWMARNTVAANLLMITLLLGGLMTVGRIKQETFPEFDLDMISVSVPYPGASPEEIEEGILMAVEEEVRGLDGVKEVTSTAVEGNGTVQIELLLGANDNKLLQDVKNAVDRITSLPEEAERPIVSLATNRQQALSLALFGDKSEHVLRELGERIRDDLLRDDGITFVELSGVRAPEISIEVSQDTLRSYGLTLSEIARQVRVQALELPGGGVKTTGGEILLRTDERRDVGMQFDDLPIVVTGDGETVRLGEIATIRDTFEDTDEAAYYNGKPAVLIDVYRVGDQTPEGVVTAVNRHMDELKPQLPEGVEIAVLQDFSRIYRERVSLLLRNAAYGLVLVMVILGLSMEVGLAFWVTMGIPVSFLGGLMLMPLCDTSVNMVSLFAFIMALGIVVDDAIVVGENVYESREHDRSLLAAAIHGARQVSVPVVFSVLTNMVAFLPMLFVPGVMGKIFRVIPIVICCIFGISLVESLFVLPSHLSHRRRKGGASKSVGPHGTARLFVWLSQRVYAPVLGKVLRLRYLTLAVGVAVLVLTAAFIRGGYLGFSFMPRVEADFLFAEATLPYGAPVAETEAIMRKLVGEAQGIAEEHGGDTSVQGIYARIGGGMANFGPVGGGATAGGSHLCSIQVVLTPADRRTIGPARFAELWRERVGEIPGLESLTYTYNIGPSGGEAINVELSHTHRETLERVAGEVAARLREYEGVTDVDDDVSLGKPQFNFRLRPEAYSLGLTSAGIAQQVRDAFYGAEALRQQRGRNEIKVMARLPEAERRSEKDIEDLLLRAPGGGEIPLLEAVDLDRDRAYTLIKRTDGRRVLNVTAEVVPGKADPSKIARDLEQVVLPELQAEYPGLHVAMKGEREEMRESMGALGRGFLFAVVVIFAMLAIPLKSYVQPLIVMTAIPFGIVGAVIGHVIMGYGLSMISMMGIVALSGVVVNDSLVMIHATNERRRNGATALEAASSAGVRRFRPIMLTSLTTFFGLAPMILETSMQARFLIPMAIALGFGVLFSTTITLLLVPSLYMIVHDVREFVGLHRVPGARNNNHNGAAGQSEG